MKRTNIDKQVLKNLVKKFDFDSPAFARWIDRNHIELRLDKTDDKYIRRYLREILAPPSFYLPTDDQAQTVSEYIEERSKKP